MTKTCQTYCWLSCLLLGIVFSYIDSTRAAEQSPAFSPFLKTAEDQPQDPQDRLVVDVDFDLRRKIETLDSLIAEKREIEAAVAMQSIFDHPNDFLLITGNQKEEYVSLKKQFLSWSSTLPAPILQAYELQFGPKAQHLLQTYDQTQDLKFLQDVSGRMILTRSGGDAAHLLSKIYLDRGRIRESLALVQQLKSIPSQRLRLEPWLMIQEAVCQARLGKLSEACAAAKPAFQNGPVTLGKQQLAYEQFCMQLGLWADDESGQSLQEWIRDLPDWPTFRRDSQRTRMTADFNMVPVPRWSVDLAPHLLGLSGEAGLEMQQAIDSISNNLNSEDYPKVPAWNPVIVNDRIYVSGFDRVACVNTKTGSVEWISATRDGALEFLFNEELKGKYEIARSNRITDSRSGGLLEPSAYVLQQLGWDLTQGALSSDEERIYTVRRSGLATVTMNTGPFLDARTHALIPIDANVLSALDARTGKLLWEIRGDAMRQQEQAMFGHFFLGAPLACPEGLFVMSESGSELFLAQLEPTTGKVLWLQPLTHPQLSITSDRPRRYAGTTPTWLAPLMVCPTNSGTIFAINPASRSIEWMLRYAQPAGPENEAFSPFQIRRQQIRDEVRKISFNADESWQECVAISTGDLILHTPLDSQDLFALDRQTGEVRWVIPRQDGLFVEVGPTGEIFIVGSRQIRCFDILGNDLWQHDLLTSIPSGRGVLRGHVYHLPLKNRDLLSLDVKTGTALAASAGTLEAPLGNLIVSHGNLYSLNGTTLTAIMSDEQLQKIIDPASPELTPAEKLSLDGQRNLHRGNPREGLQKLQESYQLARSSAVARLISEVLLNSNPQSLEIDQSLIEQLADLMISAEHPPEFTVRYLETLRLMNRPVDAYRTLKTLLENDQIRDAYVHLPQAREVYLPALAEGFVSDLYAEATNEQRRQIEQLAQAYLDGTPEANRLLTLKPLFSLPGWKVRFTYRVSQLLNSSQFPLLLEQQLIWLQQFGPAEMQPELICRLAALMLEHRDWSAAEIYRSELRTRLAQTVCHEQKTGTQWEAIFNQKYPLASSGLFDPGQIIKPRKFQQTVDPMALGSARGTRRETVPVEISGLTPWVNWNFEVEKTDHLMTAFNERHETQWYLRFDEISGTSKCQVFGSAHLGLLKSYGELYGFNSFTRPAVEVISHNWRIPFGQQTERNSKGFFTTPTHNVAGVSMLQIGWQEEAGVMGRIVNGMIPLRDHHLVMLIDGVAGITPLWQVERPESDDHLICYDGSFVYLLDSRDQRYDILRGSDGLFLKSQSLPRHDEIRGLFGSIAVLWDRIDQVSGRLVGYNLSNHEILWSIELTGSVTMTAIDDRHLALFDAGKNQILFIDPTQTTPVLFEVSAPRTTARDLYIEQDPIHWYVHITQKPAQSIPQNLGLEAGEDINGPILAISKATRKVAWSTEVEALRWIPGQMSSLPFLMYGAKQRTTRPDENGEQSFLTKSQMLLIDKRTGQQILSLPDQITGTLMQFTPDLEKQEYRWDFESGSLTVTGQPE